MVNVSFVIQTGKNTPLRLLQKSAKTAPVKLFAQVDMKYTQRKDTGGQDGTRLTFTNAQLKLPVQEEITLKTIKENVMKIQGTQDECVPFEKKTSLDQLDMNEPNVPRNLKTPLYQQDFYSVFQD